MAKSNWTIDAAHSSVDFSIKHLMIATVKGTFHSFNAEISADAADLTTADIQFTVDVDSIDTRNGDRDGHLKSPDFFDVAQFPTITFTSTEIVRTEDNEYDVSGNLTMHGVTKPAKFAVTFEGEGKDPWGNEKAGFSAEGKINRSDFGLTYNAALETGGVLIGDQVRISIQIEAMKKA